MTEDPQGGFGQERRISHISIQLRSAVRGKRELLRNLTSVVIFYIHMTVMKPCPSMLLVLDPPGRPFAPIYSAGTMPWDPCRLVSAIQSA